MSRFALLLKSYRGDLEYAKRLLTSFEKNNPDSIPLYCVVPEEDIHDFEPFGSSTVTVLSEAPLAHHFTSEPVHGIRPGYINQEIVKLSFWELGLADDYFCVDSDAVFVRNIHLSDFLAPDGVPYSVLVEDNELKVEPQYYRQHWQSREKSLRLIMQEVGLTDPVVRTCHGHQIFSSAVLVSFVRDFLEPRGWSYLDALTLSPYEFTWYAAWLQKSDTIPVHQREPLVKVFHHEAQHLEYILRGITPNDIARGYVAVVVNSNYSRDLGVVPLDASKSESLSHYLSYGEVGSLLRAKVRASFRRLAQR